MRSKCVRVYNNGDQVVLDIPDDEVEEWVEGNKLLRWGCALFVNGVCRAVGYLGDERCVAIAKCLLENPPPAPTEPYERMVLYGKRQTRFNQG